MPEAAVLETARADVARMLALWPQLEGRPRKAIANKNASAVRVDIAGDGGPAQIYFPFEAGAVTAAVLACYGAP